MKKKVKKPIDTTKVSGGVDGGSQAIAHDRIDNKHVGLKDGPKARRL